MYLNLATSTNFIRQLIVSNVFLLMTDAIKLEYIFHLRQV